MCEETNNGKTKEEGSEDYCTELGRQGDPAADNEEGASDQDNKVGPPEVTEFSFTDAFK